MERYKCPALLPPPVLLLQLGTESDSGSSRLRTASSLRRSGWPSFTAFAPSIFPFERLCLVVPQGRAGVLCSPLL